MAEANRQLTEVQRLSIRAWLAAGEKRWDWPGWTDLIGPKPQIPNKKKASEYSESSGSSGSSNVDGRVAPRRKVIREASAMKKEQQLRLQFYQQLILCFDVLSEEEREALIEFEKKQPTSEWPGCNCCGLE
jgi:hypothetical protein